MSDRGRSCQHGVCPSYAPASSARKQKGYGETSLPALPDSGSSPRRRPRDRPQRRETQEGQTHVKRVVAEMGGKNCVIVDSDADLDEVVPGIINSAFVYAGQKCSAAARVLVHEAVADTLTERLAGAVEVLRVGQADTFGTDVPPVIDDEAQARVLEYVEIARRDGRLAAQREQIPGDGHFCPPTLATDLPPDSPVLRDEMQPVGDQQFVDRFLYTPEQLEHFRSAGK